jgi:hypothetical protein
MRTDARAPAALDTAPLDTAPLDTAPLDTAPLDTAALDTATLRTITLSAVALRAVALRTAALGSVTLRTVALRTAALRTAAAAAGLLIGGPLGVFPACLRPGRPIRARVIPASAARAGLIPSRAGPLLICHRPHCSCSSWDCSASARFFRPFSAVSMIVFSALRLNIPIIGTRVPTVSS